MADYLRASIEMCRREYEEVVLKRNRLISDFIKDHFDADVSFFPDSDAAAYKRALLEAVLREVRATAVREEVPVLVLVIPSPIDICDACEVVVDPHEHPAYDRRRLTSEATGAVRRGERACPCLTCSTPSGRRGRTASTTITARTIGMQRAKTSPRDW